jgi:hypothetical protein
MRIIYAEPLKIFGYQVIGNDSFSDKAATSSKEQFRKDTYCPKNVGKT